MKRRRGTMSFEKTKKQKNKFLSFCAQEEAAAKKKQDESRAKLAARAATFQT
jgi:hypothetical protein